MTKILGISAFFHDSAASLLINGEVICAVQEERFTRKKHDSSFPLNSIDYILKDSKLSLNEIDYIVFYEKPFLKFERLIETYVSNVPKGFVSFAKAMPVWLREKLFLKSVIIKELNLNFGKFENKKILFSEHHLSHAASAFYASPFKEALILILDGVGEWATTTLAIGKDNRIEIIKEINFPHSLGLLYSAFTYYLGFKVNSGEYKVMGLSSYGKPIYKKLILEKLLDLKEDGSFSLDQYYFNYSVGLEMISQNFSNLFDQPIRKSENEKLSQFHMDIASSIQSVTEEVILRIGKNLSQNYKIPNLCLAGGVALNCVANSKLLEKNYFKNIWIQPAAGDSGGALGAALAAYYIKLKNKRKIIEPDSMKGSYLGPIYSKIDIEKSLLKSGANFKLFTQSEIITKTAENIANGKVIGWFQGRMEYGPRALGSRSILADPRSEFMQKKLNLKIKFRESFRPFAPSILYEDLSDWFKLNKSSPYMLYVADLNNQIRLELSESEKKLFGIDLLNIKRSKIPAVTHVDYSARIQTVHKETNNIYYSLIKKFKEITNCPIIINTSFNVRGEPIVCTPEDAFKCFMGTDMDILVIENFILYKEKQNSKLIINYEDKYDLD
ncbi:carbamoyltransferase [Alphaproteobacteria bacterium]|nr:carbamoyltransferase [Alphaproteobacteria bacterium]